MKEKSLRVLEYGKIINMLKGKLSSSLGLKYVEALKPSVNYEEIIHLQNETSESEGLLLNRGNVPLGGIHDIEQLAKKCKIGSCLDAGQLLMVADTLRAARILKNSINNDSGEAKYPIIEGLANALNTYRAIEESIYNAIVSEIEIADSASSELRNLRRQILQKNQGIRAKLNSIISSSTFQKYLQDAIITMRGDRFVVPVKAEYRSLVAGIIHDQSASGATLFIEPMSIVEMNNSMRELKLKEKEEIERILMELSSLVGEYGDEIIANGEILGNLDFIFAKGKLSLDMKGVQPKITKDKYINIKKGRHPLLDKNKVVPTNLYIGKEFNTLVITGPNTGGKTVTLKTLGIFALMTQSGLHIPADYGSVMCVFDNIFADIGDEQSIEQNLSTFSSHMTNIVDILEDVTGESLVLFDELGAGTDPIEGAAIAMAILDHLLEMKALTVATTHYTELKNYALTKEKVENACVEFDVETLSPTYRLLIGVPGKSNAFEISQKIGLSRLIIDKAKTLINSENIKLEDLLASIEKNRINSEKERATAEKYKRDAMELKEKFEEKNEKLVVYRDKVIEEAKREALKIVKRAKDDADGMIKELRKIEREASSTEKNKKIEKVRREISKSMGDLEGSFQSILIPKISSKEIKELKKGETVKVITLNTVGNVLTVDMNKKEALVQMGIMKMNLPFSALEKIDEASKSVSKTGAGKIMKRKAINIKSELDLRGLNLEEAMLETDKYLDDAYLAGLTHATIIHGIGTGILKSGIKEMLKRHKHVKSYRDGVYGEGGHGVTIVEF